MKNISESYTLNLFNTLTNKKEPVVNSEDNNKIKMYVCGITPYDFAHLGHGRCYIMFDVIYRLLTLLDYRVTYCRNFTDIDDKIIKRAESELNNGLKYLDISNKFIKAFHEDLKLLNCLEPQCEPRVTENIPAIISFIQGLIDKKIAYEKNGNIYYSIDKFQDYGKLSKRNIEDLKAGARISVREEKENLLDFALWKKAESGPGWQSPWSFGRPGWHIECSALAKEYLGETLDIHGGGMDLIFPHHENEIAQSEGLSNKTFSKIWVHNAFVLVDKEKMSKSLGNFVTLRQIIDQFGPMIIRYYILVHHYRNPLEFSKVDIDASAKSYERLVKFFENLKDQENTKNTETCLEDLPLVSLLVQALCDDLNIAKFFGILFENLKELEKDEKQANLVRLIIQQVLGLTLEPLVKKQVKITPEIQKLINQREEARKVKNWKVADEIRDQLQKLGVDLKDKKI